MTRKTGKYFTDILRNLFKRVRVRTGELGIGFHHHLLGWAGYVTRLQGDSEEQVITLSDSVQPELRQSHLFQERAVWELRGAYVKHRTGTVMIQKGAVRDVVRAHIQRRTPSYRTRSLWAVKAGTGPIVFCAHNPRNYYHWFLEDLPAILRARSVVPSSVLALPAGQPDYVHQTLELLSLCPTRFVRRDFREATLIVASQGIDSGWPHPSDVALLQKKLPPVRSRNLAVPKKIYVSRRFARRNYRNDEVVEDEMARLGVEVIFPEQLPLQEQMELFASADTIVAPHGAGLTNMLFCRPGTRVLELALVSWALPTYELLASHCQLNYTRLLIPSPTGEKSVVLEREQLAAIAAWLNEKAARGT